MNGREMPVPEHDEPKAWDDQLPKDIEDHLMMLERETARLSSMGRVIFLDAALTIMCLTLFAVGGSLVDSFGLLHGIRAGVIFTSLTGILYIVKWERRKEIAMAIYEETSDEIEWSHRTFRSRNRPEGSPNLPPLLRPLLGIRVAMRRFLVAAKLPLVPEQYSALIYSLLFLLCIAIAALLPRQPYWWLR